MADSIYRLGCDIGGTFTDFVLLNSETGEIKIFKCLTTPTDPSIAVEEGIKSMVGECPGFVERLDEVIHGTTLVINAIIERKGARTGLITTKGFRDVLEIGSEKRYDNYDIFAVYPEPLVTRSLRLEVTERIYSDGHIQIPLEADEVITVLKKLIGMEIESLAVCLLNSFENPKHELMIKDIISNKAQDLSVSISYDVLPQIREYERTSTTVANAYVKPLTQKYLAKLSERLSVLGFAGRLFIMLSSGGITSAETAQESPVRIIESGPTAAVIAGQYYGKMFDIKNMFCFDMGGTTAKSCLIQEGEAGMVSTFEVGRVHRFSKGSGLPIQVPVVDLMEIGAGGGSIARISELGLLQVGPDSAGASPGPVCYSFGGKAPTVTDADLVLGYLDPNYFLGGVMKLDKGAAERAIEEKIAKPLGISLYEAAWGIHDLINETMGGAAKTHIAEKGGNPKIVSIVAFGGAGPVHAFGLAKKLKSRQIIIPLIAGVGSALGFFTAPRAYDLVRSHKIGLNEADFDSIERLFQEMEHEGKVALQKVGSKEQILYDRSADIRFIGQGYETNISLRESDFSELSREKIRKLFDDTYENLYGRTYPESPIEFVTFRVRARLPERPLRLPQLGKKGGSLEKATKGQRHAYSPIDSTFILYNIYDRYSLYPGASFDGPAIIEEKESTVIIGRDASVFTDDYGFLWIDLKEK